MGDQVEVRSGPEAGDAVPGEVPHPVAEPGKVVAEKRGENSGVRGRRAGRLSRRGLARRRRRKASLDLFEPDLCAIAGIAGTGNSRIKSE